MFLAAIVVLVFTVSAANAVDAPVILVQADKLDDAHVS